jgi:hypothetical protein
MLFSSWNTFDVNELVLLTESMCGELSRATFSFVMFDVLSTVLTLLGISSFMLLVFFIDSRVDIVEEVCSDLMCLARFRMRSLTERPGRDED